MRYTLTVPFVASKGRPRAGNGRVYTPKATRQAEEDIAKLWIAEHGGRVLFSEPIAVACLISIFLRRTGEAQHTPAPSGIDADNACKLLLDALQGLAYENDRQITTIHVRKVWAGVSASESEVAQRMINRYEAP